MINKFFIGQKVHCGVVVGIIHPTFYIYDLTKKLNTTEDALLESFKVWDVKHPEWKNQPLYRVYLFKPFVNPTMKDFLIRYDLPDDMSDHVGVQKIYNTIKKVEIELLLPENEIQPYEEVEENKDNNEQKEDISL